MCTGQTSLHVFRAHPPWSIISLFLDIELYMWSLIWGGSIGGSSTALQFSKGSFFILQPVQVVLYILQWNFGFTFYILKITNFTVKFYQGNLPYEVPCYIYRIGITSSAYAGGKDVCLDVPRARARKFWHFCNQIHILQRPWGIFQITDVNFDNFVTGPTAFRLLNVLHCIRGYQNNKTSVCCFLSQLILRLDNTKIMVKLWSTMVKNSKSNSKTLFWSDQSNSSSL